MFLLINYLDTAVLVSILICSNCIVKPLVPILFSQPVLLILRENVKNAIIWVITVE